MDYVFKPTESKKPTQVTCEWQNEDSNTGLLTFT